MGMCKMEGKKLYAGYWIDLIMEIMKITLKALFACAHKTLVNEILQKNGDIARRQCVLLFSYS